MIILQINQELDTPNFRILRKQEPKCTPNNDNRFPQNGININQPNTIFPGFRRPGFPGPFRPNIPYNPYLYPYFNGNPGFNFGRPPIPQEPNVFENDIDNDIGGQDQNFVSPADIISSIFYRLLSQFS